jgi:hypothetical protein
MAARFVELTTTRSDQTSAESIGMEEAQDNYNYQYERRRVDVHLGNE